MKYPEIKPLSNDQILDRVPADLGDGESVLICDLCGAWVKASLGLRFLKHRMIELPGGLKVMCPEAGGQHGD